MKKNSMKLTKTSPKNDDIPELTLEQLTKNGPGVRGQYFLPYTQNSNVVVLRPELMKAFPTSEAVNNALASFLAFVQEAKTLTHPSKARTKTH